MPIFPLGIVGPWEIVIIALIVLLLFGGKKIPELMKGLGKGVKSFKDGLNADRAATPGPRKANKTARTWMPPLTTRETTQALKNKSSTK